MGQEQHRRQGKWARSNIAARTDPNRSKDEPGPLPSRPRHHQAASKQSNTIAGTWILILHSKIVQPKHQQPPKTPHTTPKRGADLGGRKRKQSRRWSQIHLASKLQTSENSCRSLKHLTPNRRGPGNPNASSSKPALASSASLSSGACRAANSFRPTRTWHMPSLSSQTP